MKHIQIASLAIITILFLSYSLYSLSEIKKLSNTIGNIYYEQQVVSTLQDILLNLKNAESSRRGYIITHNAEYVHSYHSYVDNVEGSIQNLKTFNLTKEYNDQFIDSLIGIISQKLAFLQSSIDAELNQSSTDSLQVALTDEGRQTMKTIRDIIQKMSAEKQQDMYRKYTKAKEAKELSDTMTNYFISFFLIAIGVAAVLMYIYSKKIYMIDEKYRNDLNDIRTNAVKTIAKLEQANEKLRNELHEIAVNKK